MESVSKQARDQLFATFQSEVVHLEMRDIYATKIETESK